MTRPLIAAGIIAAVLVGGLALGVMRTVADEDSGDDPGGYEWAGHADALACRASHQVVVPIL